MVYKYKSANSGKDRFLLLEDILTRRAWAYVLPSNSIADVLTAYEKFAGEVGKKLNSVEGDDFFSAKAFLEYNEKLGVTVSTIVAADEHMVKGGGDKLGLIDRLCRTLKDLLGKLVLSKGSTRWTAFLSEAVSLYNETPHSSLHSMSPDQAYGDIDAQIEKMKEDRAHNDGFAKGKFEVGDRVRIRLPTRTFAKEGAQFSTEIYRIAALVGNRYRVENADTGVELGRVLQASEMRKFAEVKTAIPRAHARKQQSAAAADAGARKLAREQIVDKGGAKPKGGARQTRQQAAPRKTSRPPKPKVLKSM